MLKKISKFFCGLLTALIILAVLTAVAAYLCQRDMEKAAEGLVFSPDQLSAAPAAGRIVVIGSDFGESLPKPVLAARVDAAAALYQQGKAVSVLIVGSRAPQDAQSEGQYMYAYAVEKGIPPDVLAVGPPVDDLYAAVQYAALQGDGAALLFPVQRPYAARVLFVASTMTNARAYAYEADGADDTRSAWQQSIFHALSCAKTYVDVKIFYTGSLTPTALPTLPL